MTCVQLGDVFSNLMGNCTAGRAWFARARRLVGDQPPCIEQGWVAVAEMGCEVPDPAELLADSELALERARQFGDVNLETKALADGGLAHVQAGRPRGWRCSTRRWRWPAARRRHGYGGQVGVLVLHRATCRGTSSGRAPGPICSPTED